MWGFQIGPVLVLAALGGVIADRFGKSRSLIPLHAGLGLVQLLLALFATRSGIGLSAIIATAGAYGVLAGVEMPVRQSLISELVPASALGRAVALHQTAFNLTRMVSPVLAVAVMAAAGPQLSFLIGAITSTLAASAFGATGRYVFTSPGQVPVRRRTTIFRGGFAAFRSGVAVSARNPQVRAILAVIAIVSVTGTGYQAILSVHLAGSLAMDPSGYGVVLSAIGLGTLAGSAAAAVMGSRRRPRVRIVAATLLLLVVAIPLARGIGTILPLVCAAGLCYGLLTARSNAAVQGAVDRKVIGRVVGHYLAVVNGGMAISAIFYGIVADAIGTDLTFATVAGSGLACLAVVWLPWHRLRCCRRD